MVPRPAIHLSPTGMGSVLTGCLLVSSLVACAASTHQTFTEHRQTTARPAPVEQRKTAVAAWTNLALLPDDWTQEQQPTQLRPGVWVVKERTGLSKTIHRGESTTTDCFQGVWLTGDARSDLEALGARCGMLQGMRPFSGPIRLPEVSRDAPQFVAMSWEAGHCYRVIVVADDDIDDIDATLVASFSGRPAAQALGERDERNHNESDLPIQDEFSDAAPILPWRGLFCPKQDGPFIVGLKATEGKADCWMQVWQKDFKRPARLDGHTRQSVR